LLRKKAAQLLAAPPFRFCGFRAGGRGATMTTREIRCWRFGIPLKGFSGQATEWKKFRMRIEKSRIFNAEAYLAAMPQGARLKIATILDTTMTQRLEALGFGPSLATGDTILPKPVGAVSRFNADGGWHVFRDRPKEERYIRTVSWRWKQWAGRGQTEEKEGLRDIYRECYPREFIEPPALEITFIEKGEQRLAVISSEFVNLPEHLEKIRYAINLMLELFGVCDLVRDDLSTYSPPAKRQVNWKMLPPGKYPWERLEDHLTATLSRTSENTQKVILDRQQFILALGPTETYVGSGGFSDYLAYVFGPQRLVVLESIRYGNAIYAFGMDWQRAARLTKAEVLSDKMQSARIIHADGWKTRLTNLLRPRDAA
jgi:hypothetical protein